MRILFRTVLTPLLALAILGAGVSFALATGGGSHHPPPPPAEEVYPCIPSTIGGMDPSQVAALIDSYYGDGDGVLDIDQLAGMIQQYFGGSKAYYSTLLNQFFGGGGGNCEPECPQGRRTTEAPASHRVRPGNVGGLFDADLRIAGGGGTTQPCKPKAKTGSYCA